VETEHVERHAMMGAGGAAAPRAVIAEDEATLADELREQLHALWPGLEICAMARDGLEAIECLDRHQPQVLFLDIEMPGANGLEVARHANGRCHVVFVTAFDHYAADAFEEGAIDYVRKPFHAGRLRNTVQRLQERLAQPPGDLAPLLRELAARAGAARPYLRWLNASRGQEICLITVEEVVYFKAEDKYTLVMTANGEALIRKTIKDLVAELDPDMFWQIHRSTVVNANEVAGVRRDFRGHMEVKLKSRPEALAVAESYHRVFRQS
jgi:DNA-binding LytR/AlgR family response regulator